MPRTIRALLVGAFLLALCGTAQAATISYHTDDGAVSTDCSTRHCVPAGVAVHFEVATTASDDRITWDAGTGLTGVGRTVDFTFQPGQYRVAVRIASSSGGMPPDTGVIYLDALAPPPPPPPPAEPVAEAPSAAQPTPCQEVHPAISINGGALFTNTLAVTIAVQKECADTTTVLSNDGGFAQASPFTDAAIPWTLSEVGPADSVSRTVYARVGPFQVTDDIILDNVAPQPTSATTDTGTANAASIGRLSRTFRKGHLRIRVRDNASGPRSVRVRHARHGVRVQAVDYAGNVSRWKLLRVKRR
jgi:hypothetical protein